jgi:hypothetical protein
MQNHAKNMQTIGQVISDNDDYTSNFIKTAPRINDIKMKPVVPIAPKMQFQQIKQIKSLMQVRKTYNEEL